MFRINYPETAARFVLILAICAMSWAYGGVEPIAKVWVARLVGLSAVLLLLSKPSLTFATRALPTVWIVLGLAVGLGAVQLLDIGSSVVESVSPNAASSRTELGLAQSDVRQLTVSPPQTRRDLSLLLVGVAGFVVASQVFQSVGSQLFLCFSIALNGAALSIWGLIQQLGNSNELLPGVKCEVNSIIFSTYVNHSSAAGFLNMCLGATIGLLLWRYRSSNPYHDEATSFGEATKNFLRSLTPILLLLSLMTTLMIAALGASLSRGGCLATLAAFVAVTLFVARRRSSSAGFSTTVIAVAIGVAALVWVGFAGPLANRYTSMVSHEGQIDDGRFGHWGDGLRAAKNFLVTGSGLGTYSSVYLTVEENDHPHWFRHAHNQYLEALVDGGVPGLLLLLAAFVMVSRAAWYLATRREVGVHSWFGIGVLFLLVSQAVHAVTDFGLYIPANMLLCAVMSGAVAGSAASTGKSALLRMPTFLSRPIVWNVLVFGGCVFAMNHLQGMETAHKTLDLVSLDARTSQRPELADIQQDLQLLDAAIQTDPTNSRLHYRKARLLLLRYQAMTFNVLLKNDGLARPEIELWQRASAEHLHAALVGLTEEDRQQQVEVLMAEPIVQNIVAARKELLTARSLNAFHPRAHVYLAILAPIFGESDLEHLDHAESLANTDAATSFDCGLLHLRANRTTRAIESWRRSLRFSRDHADLVLSIGSTRLDDATLVNEVMPDDPVLLVRLAESRKKVNAESRLVRLLAQRVLEMSNVKSTQQTDYFRGRAATLIGDESLAAQHFGAAVDGNPNRADWRFRYAVALSNTGRLQEAKTQLQWCLGVAPRDTRYQQLMQTVERRSRESEL